MLAWVFWHTRFEHVTEDEYTRNLRAFRERIGSAAPDGFLGSRVLAYDALPWLPSATEVYEDWYFVRDSSALDHLEEAALAAFTHDSHERIARLAEKAVAGLYRLWAGSPLPHPPYCSWINKPRGESYETFISGILRAGAVWTRKMVLGPTPEFCVESDHKPRLPGALMTMPTRTQGEGVPNDGFLMRRSPGNPGTVATPSICEFRSRATAENRSRDLPVATKLLSTHIKIAY